MGFDALTFHALPNAGGLRDQPVKLMRTIRAALNVHAAMREYERGYKPGKAAAWKSEHPDEWDVVSEVRELRSKHGHS